jgi:hypothetical protein
MHLNHRNVLLIPSNWTAPEALAVASFLEDVLHSVYLVHGDAIGNARALSGETPDEDDFPSLEEVPY